MGRGRSSIRGKGAEILFGAPTAPEIRPRSSDPIFTTRQEPKPQPVPAVVASDGDVETVDDSTPSQPLEGAAAGQAGGTVKAGLDVVPVAGREETSPDPGAEGEMGAPLDEESPLTPEVESALLAEARAGEEPARSSSVPASRPPVLSQPEQDGVEAAVFHEPLSEESVGSPMGVLPPRPDRMPFDQPSSAWTGADIQEPPQKVEPEELPDRLLAPGEGAEIVQRFGSERIAELTAAIGQLYDQTLSEVGGSEQAATQCQNLLLKARDIIARQDAARLPQAEYYVAQVRARLKRARESETSARTYGWWITGWGFVWGMVFVGLLIAFGSGAFEDRLMPAHPGWAAVDLRVFLPSMVWGGIGAVVAILYSLFKHVSQQDFDLHYGLSYVGKPFFGLILGGTVYMIVYLMVMMLGIWPGGLQPTVDGSNAPMISPWLVYLLAWVSGFNENRIFGLVDRVMGRIFTRDEGETIPGGLDPGVWDVSP